MVPIAAEHGRLDFECRGLPHIRACESNGNRIGVTTIAASVESPKTADLQKPLDPRYTLRRICALTEQASPLPDPVPY
jgi:hypothetical protein